MTYDEALTLFSKASGSSTRSLNAAIRLFVDLGVLTINEPKVETTFDLMPQTDPEPGWKIFARWGEKFQAIKAHRAQHNSTLTAAKDVVLAFIAGGCK